ncbi:MAG: hypothetical protein A2Z99_05345 [Treponema sp. GWB1_62_6]|nr:MAG: hypothetical protein A2Y36_14465 [Treponema sp. GWA1_62_8]OHE68285.1 MAG: hypothetical protein A2413_09615 [Treponema sp. RIFOXYC1_FULL_61_9]OHE69327.1 MAG: hypothetical protein A2001_12655 [Treponema sp. GWC1_61_84]OHE70738.1 MAG: hypothetical protein A2Z99_05345 [Treponema sp. GWB1_62_6]HCM26259.1 hypothetical protein [Treponema sp.]
METYVRSTFISAAKLVLDEIGFRGLSVDEIPAADASIEIVAAVGIVGDLKGHFVMIFGKGVPERFVDALSIHLGMDGDDGDAIRYRKAAIGEIANQISGRAAALLGERKTDCMITPPTVIAGTGVETSLPESDDRNAFSVHGDFGELGCIIALKSAKTA